MQVLLIKVLNVVLTKVKIKCIKIINLNELFMILGSILIININ